MFLDAAAPAGIVIAFAELFKAALVYALPIIVIIIILMIYKKMKK